jgi:Leucine-rich repeat (LRR) protein
MNSEEALSLHNAFRRAGKWHATHAFSSEEPPRDEVLTLDSIYLVSPSADWIAKIAQSGVLRSLAIKTPRTSDLRPLGRLALTQFEVSYPTRIKDWDFLSQLTRLRRLVVENATTFSDLSCLRDLRSAEFLGVAGSYSEPLKADSLQSLAGMASLRAIFLANIRLEDWDLSPLRQLKHLELLYTPKWCPTEQIKALRNAIPALAWNWDKI